MREDTARTFHPPLLPRASVSLAKSHARGRPRPYPCFSRQKTVKIYQLKERSRLARVILSGET